MPRSVRLALALGAIMPPMAAAASPSPFAAPFGDIASDAPGCAVSVAQAGRAPVSGGFGLADIAAQRPITGRTVFGAASISKQFTAFAILSLAQDGKLSLSDPARKFVPELGTYADAITIADLLHHMSGIRDFVSLNRIEDGPAGRPVLTPARVQQLLFRQTGGEVPPGTEKVYSNSGYYLLSLVATRASGETMQQLLDRLVFRPLGMRDTRVGDPDPALAGPVARSYAAAAGGSFEPVPPTPVVEGAGGMRTTAADLAKWMENFWTARAGGRRVVAMMIEPGRFRDGSPSDYAGGLTISRYRDLPVARHGGSLDGFRHQIVILPEQRFGVAVLCNRTDARASFRAEAVIDAALARQLGPVSHSTPVLALERGAHIDAAAVRPGAYRDTNGGEYLGIRKEGERILLDYRGRSLPLVAVTPTVYATEPLVGWPIHIAFRPDRVAMEYAGDYDDFDWAPPWQPGDLSRWAGRYHSAEANATITLAMAPDGKGLTATLGPATVPLHPGRPGEFAFLRGALIVPLDTPGRWISPFILGLRGLRYERVDKP